MLNRIHVTMQTNKSLVSIRVGFFVTLHALTTGPILMYFDRLNPRNNYTYTIEREWGQPIIIINNFCY